MRRRRSCSETDPDLEIYEREWRRVEASEKLPFDPTLPADEHIALQSLWLVDVFLPSRASALLTGLEHLGLRDGSSEGGLSTEIAAARGSAYTASISPIGPFVPSGAAILTQVVREDLPGGVEAAWGWVYQITPAVTVIVWQFTLNDEESHKLEEVFRVHHQGTARRLGPDRITYTSKADVAQRAARGHRAAIRRRCTAWHRAIFDDPGATAAILPGIDLILTDVADPATAAAGRDRGFLRCLDLGLFESDQRVCADLPECALHISRDVAHVFTLVAQRKRLAVSASNRFRRSEPATGWDISQFLHESPVESAALCVGLVARANRSHEAFARERDLAFRSERLPRRAAISLELEPAV